MNVSRTLLSVSIAATLIAVGLLGCLAIAISLGCTQSVDSYILLAVHRWASPALTLIMQGTTTFGSVVFIGASFVICLIGFIVVGWRRPAARLAWVMVGAVALDNGLKYGFHRARPEPFFGTAPASYSFPSGHALFSFCFYGTLAIIITARVQSRLAKIAIWTAAVLLVAAIGLSRIYLGVHYPTDVLGGYLTAAAVMAAVSSIGRLKMAHRTQRKYSHLPRE